MNKPYIGITGFMTAHEALNLLDFVPRSTKRLFMIGVLASSKTMNGIPNKWPNRYPAMHAVADIFPDDPRALNLIHYNTKEKDTLGDQLLAMTEFGGDNLHGFQLNIAWPDREVLEWYREVYPEKQIVLQIGGGAFQKVDNSPDKLASRVAEYEGVVEYVLLDPSGGRGEPFDTERARDYLRALAARNLNIGLGAAGGLGPTTLHLIKPLLPEFPELSMDAEGRLRTPEDNLDLTVSGKYLREAFAIV